MRVGYVVLVAFAALLSNANAESVSANSITKKKFTITSPNSSDTMDAVFVQEGNEKFLVLHLKDDDASDNASSEDSGEEDESSEEDASGSDGQEERAAISAGAADKLKKTFSGEFDTKWNKLWWKFWRGATPKNYRLPDTPKFPARFRPLKVNTN